jgi:hypothetical protein
MGVPDAYKRQTGGLGFAVSPKKVSRFDGIEAGRASRVGRRVHLPDLLAVAGQHAARLQWQAVEAMRDDPVPQTGRQEQHADEAICKATYRRSQTYVDQERPSLVLWVGSGNVFNPHDRSP